MSVNTWCVIKSSLCSMKAIVTGSDNDWEERVVFRHSIRKTQTDININVNKQGLTHSLYLTFQLQHSHPWSEEHLSQVAPPLLSTSSALFTSLNQALANHIFWEVARHQSSKSLVSTLNESLLNCRPVSPLTESRLKEDWKQTSKQTAIPGRGPASHTRHYSTTPIASLSCFLFYSIKHQYIYCKLLLVY